MNKYSQDIMDRLRALKPSLMKDMKIKRLRVFGSVARGEATEGSDVDLIVDFEGRPTLMTLASTQRRLKNQIKKDIDLLTEGSLHPAFKENILKEAQDV